MFRRAAGVAWRISQGKFLLQTESSTEGMTKPRLGSGLFPQLSESLRPCDLDLQTEIDTNNGDLTSPAWIDQCFETCLSLDADWQLETLLCSSMPQSAAPDQMSLKKARKAEPPATTTKPSAPPSPESSDSSYHQQNGAIPRHKRPSHRRAELKRRDKIKTRLDEVKVQVPSMADKGKLSECTVLSKAAEYTKHLLGDCERFSTEAGNLRREIESLRSDIHSLHEQLPAAGLKQETVEKSQRSMDKLCQNYVAGSIKDNWKFYLFGFMVKPLFESYKEEVSTDSTESFQASVEEWTSSRLSLSSLRHQTLENMRDITRQTDIMSDPASLPKQALASVAHMSDSVTLPSSSSVTRQSMPAASTPFSEVCRLSAPSALASSLTDVGHRSTPVALASSTDVGRMSVAEAFAPSTADVNRLTAPVTLVSSSDGSHQSPQLISSRSSDILHLLATRPSVPAFTNSHSFSSFTIPRTTAQQNLTPRFSPPPPSKPATRAKGEAPIQDHHRLSKPASMSTRKRASGPNCSGTVSEKGLNESSPVTRKRESLDCATTQIPLSPLSVSAPARNAVEQQPPVTLQMDFSEIGQLAASVEETSLHMNAPIAVVTPTPSLTTPIAVVIPNLSQQQQQLPTTSVACLMTDSQCHEYDFDLTDIPLLDL